jgi:hypothetical protein
MSKEKESAPLKEFNILDTPFGEGLEMQFTDEFKEDNSVSKTSLDSSLTNEVDETSADETAKTETKEVKKETKETPIQETEEEVKGTTSTESTETTTSEDSSLKVFASWLGDKGLVDYDEETFEDSEDGLKKLMSSTVEKEVERYKQSLPEDVHKLVEFVEAGGDPKQFMDLYYNQSSWADFKLEDESDSKAVLKEYLKAQGEDEDEINETLDTYEISGILEKKAKAALTKLQNAEKSYQEQLVEVQKKYDAEQKELAKKQYEDFKAKLYAKDEIQGFKLTPKMKDNLWDFIMKPDKTGKTGLQKHNETNENAQFMYAYLAMNDWDMSKLEVKVKNKVNSELASKLSNFKDGRSKLKTGQNDSFSQERSTGNFSAFKQALNNGLL